MTLGAVPEHVEQLCDVVDRLATERIDSAAIDASGTIPPGLLAELADLGLFGLSLPEEHGGAGLSLAETAPVVTCLARHDRSVATTVGLHNGLGTAALVAFGSAELQAELLPALASGSTVAAFAATEAGAGSDLMSVSTRGTEVGGELRLDGAKVFVTNGGLADVFTVLVSTPGLGGRRGHSLVIVRGDDRGLTVGPEEHKLGLRGSSTTPIYFEDVRLPLNRVIGEAGRGMDYAGHSLAWGRTVMAAGCLGSAERALALTMKHTAERRQFNKALAELPVVRDRLADAVGTVFAMRALVQFATDSEGTELLRRSIAAKVLCSEGGWEVCDAALQLHGGLGYTEESGVPLLLRDARVTRIFEGANDVLLTHAGVLALRGDAAPTVLDHRARLRKEFGLGLLTRPRMLARLGRTAVLADLSAALASPQGEIAAAHARQGILAMNRLLPHLSGEPSSDVDTVVAGWREVSS